MKRIITAIITLLISAGFLFMSCTKPPCACDFAPVDYVDIRLVDAQGRNLVFGPASRFSADTISILKNDKDLSVHNASVSRSPANTADLRLNFYVPAERSFLYYHQQTPTDTVDVVWATKTGRCCGHPETYQSIESVRLNGVVLQAQGGSYFIVK